MKIWTDKTLAVPNLQPSSRSGDQTKKYEALTDSVDLSGVAQYVEASQRALDPQRIASLRNAAAQMDSTQIADALISRAFDVRGEQ